MVVAPGKRVAFAAAPEVHRARWSVAVDVENEALGEAACAAVFLAGAD
jgi:hypothetical protein